MAPNEKKKPAKTPAHNRSGATDKSSDTSDRDHANVEPVGKVPVKGQAKTPAKAQAKPPGNAPHNESRSDESHSNKSQTETAVDSNRSTTEQLSSNAEAHSEDALPSFADELGIEELTDILHGHKGRIFSAAGRESPVAEFAANGVLLRPAQKPYSDEDPGEIIIFGVDPRGVLLNELGQPRKIVGAKFKGHHIFTLAETKPGTVKHYAAWFDDENRTHKLYVQGQALTSDMIFRIRNRTLDGEISIFSEITTD